MGEPGADSLLGAAENFGRLLNQATLNPVLVQRSVATVAC